MNNYFFEEKFKRGEKKRKGRTTNKKEVQDPVNLLFKVRRAFFPNARGTLDKMNAATKEKQVETKRN